MWKGMGKMKRTNNFNNMQLNVSKIKNNNVKINISYNNSNHFKLQTQRMADIIKVKAKRTYEWDQDNKYIFVKINMPGHNSIKNVQIFLSDLILRITSKQKKSAQALDLYKEVDYLSQENKFLLMDGVLNATLKKKNAGEKWQALLIEDISLAELKSRRKQSEGRYEKNIKEVQQLKQHLKTEYDRMATKELMRFEQQQRKKLDKKKNDEKQEALNEVFRNIDEKTGKIEYEEQKWKKKGESDLQRLEKQQQEQRQRAKQQKRRLQQQKYLKQKANKNQNVSNKVDKKNLIFNEEDIKQQDNIRANIEEEIEQVPVRKQAKVSVKFTEKIYPNVATRDYHYTQPPMPKHSAPLPPPRQGDLENRNPLWLKDRGDAFMSNKNYSAALDAYDQAIKIDSSQRKILMNRSLAHMKLFNLDSCITDCDVILLQMQKQLVNNQENKDESLTDLIKIKTRKALCQAWKGKLKQSKQLLEQQLTFPISAQIKEQIQHSLSIIRSREESIQTKLKGDELVKRQSYNQAISHYNKSIAIDNNQYSISNKCLCLNKVEKYEDALELSNQGIRIIEDFIINASAANKNNNQYTGILMKLLYRKSNAQEALKRNKQAEQTLKKALSINPEQKEIKSALVGLQERQSKQQFAKLKEEASVKLTKQNNPEEALKIYAKCLKLVEGPDKVSDYLAILQNQCVCYLKLQQFDNIIATSIRILNIVNNIKNKIVQFGDKKNTSLTKPVLNKIAIRTLMRRANAYLMTGQVYNSKADLQKAVQIDPTDQNVAKQLLKLKQSIGVA